MFTFKELLPVAEGTLRARKVHSEISLHGRQEAKPRAFPLMDLCFWNLFPVLGQQSMCILGLKERFSSESPKQSCALWQLSTCMNTLKTMKFLQGYLT